MVAASIMFVGCGSSSSNNDNNTTQNNNSTATENTNPTATENNTTTTENNNTTTENNNTTVVTPAIISGTTVIGDVRFTNLDDTSTKLSYDEAKQECETFVATDGSEGWKLPTIDQLLLLLSGDNNTINESVIPLFTPDTDKPEETSHTSAIWSDTISINSDNNTSDPDYRDALFLGEKRVITQNIVDPNQSVNYYTVCVKDVNSSN